MLNVESDVLSVNDRSYSVTLKRPGSSLLCTISSAFLLTIHKTAALENDISNQIQKMDAQWRLPVSQTQFTPVPGDVLVDSCSRCWTLTGVEHLSQVGQWKCSAINLSVRYGLDTWVDQFRRVWMKDACGAPESTLMCVMSGIIASVSVKSVQLEPKFSRQDQASGYDNVQPNRCRTEVLIYFSQPLDISCGDMFLTPDGRVFRAVEYIPGDAVLKLPMLIAEEEDRYAL